MIKRKLITVNRFSRPGTKLKDVKGIVLHWTATPKGTPKGVYNYFEGRKKGKDSYGSAQYCVGIDGEIWQYIPDDEMAYHVGSKTYTDLAIRNLGTYPNNSTIGIEMCHLSWEGDFTDETWDRTRILVALLLKEHDLTVDDIYTHSDIVGWKKCPKWFCDFPEEFKSFKNEVNEIMGNIYGYNTAYSLNVRDDVMGKKIDKLTKHEEVQILGVKDGWFKIYTKNGVIGYVHGGYIKI